MKGENGCQYLICPRPPRFWTCLPNIQYTYIRFTLPHVDYIMSITTDWLPHTRLLKYHHAALYQQLTSSNWPVRSERSVRSPYAGPVSVYVAPKWLCPQCIESTLKHIGPGPPCLYHLVISCVVSHSIKHALYTLEPLWTTLASVAASEALFVGSITVSKWE